MGDTVYNLEYFSKLSYFKSCQLARLSADRKSTLRTEVVSGFGLHPGILAPGAFFVLFGKSIENSHPDATRQVSTSNIKIFEQLDASNFVFETESGSIYKITYDEAFDFNPTITLSAAEAVALNVLLNSI